MWALSLSILPGERHDPAAHFLWWLLFVCCCSDCWAGTRFDPGATDAARRGAWNERTLRPRNEAGPAAIFFPAQALASELVRRGCRVVVMTDGRGHNYGKAFPGAEIADCSGRDTFSGPRYGGRARCRDRNDCARCRVRIDEAVEPAPRARWWDSAAIPVFR